MLLHRMSRINVSVQGSRHAINILIPSAQSPSAQAACCSVAPEQAPPAQCRRRTRAQSPAHGDHAPHADHAPAGGESERKLKQII